MAEEHKHADEKAKKAEVKSKPVSKPKVKEEKKKPSYKIVRSAEAVKLAAEKSRLARKRAKFKRPGYGKMMKVKNRWRRPKGIDSRQRQGFKCKPPMPNTGYMTAQAVRGAHPTGYFPVRVCNTAGLSGVDHKTQAIIIASTVGRKKRVEIQKAAQEKKIQVLNYKE